VTGRVGHRRRSIRLPGYDYARAGAYFVTIVTQDRQCLFGPIQNGQMRLNDAGQMVHRWWAELRNKFPHVIPDTRIVMPNHFHGIIVITDEPVGADLRVCPDDLRVCPDDGPDEPVRADLRVCPDDQGAHTGAPLPEIVQWFKTMTTNEYIRGVKTLGWIPFRGRLWQRNYYEHIIRNETSLQRIARYILDNPGQWATDAENPERQRT
jgi:putative transposase